MRKRKCFISAAYGDQLQILQRVLDRLQVAWEWATSTSVDQPILNSVVDAVKKADFVIGVLHEPDARHNVLLELGMAIGLGKPFLLLKTADIELPSELSGSPQFTTDLKDERLLSFHLDLFLRSLEGKPRSKRTFPFAASKTATLNEIPPPAIFESAVEQSVAAAIGRAGGRVTIPSQTGEERTPDLLMWLPQLDKDLFNPAAIEVVGSPKLADLKTQQLRLAGFIRSTGIRCGLIVVNSISLEPEIGKLIPIPYVFVLTLHDLKTRLESSELASWVKRERNRLAHGVR
jgi:hypothetical protein